METIIRKTLLYKSGVEYADYSLNHILGCSHGCRFPCYAYLMKKRCGVVRNYEEWCRPKIVSNALELLEKEIRKLKHSIKRVHLCFSTDPFMYGQEEVSKLSLQIIGKLNSAGIRCTILTKGILPQQIATSQDFRKDNEYGITLVSLNEGFRREVEPNAASYSERLDSLRYLHRKGLKTWVSMEPYPPANLIEQDIDEILEQLTFIDKLVFGRLNYNRVVSEKETNKRYYNDLSTKVMKFCRRNGIAFHVKNGTITKT